MRAFGILLVLAVACGGGKSPPSPGSYVRIALRAPARADLVRRGPDRRPLLRIALPLPPGRVALAVALDRSRWSMTLDGTPIDPTGAELFAFPAPESPTEAALAVWVVPWAGSPGRTVSVLLRGDVNVESFALALGSSELLATVDVLPIAVFTPGREQRPRWTASDLRLELQRFARFLSGYCNIGLNVLPGREIEVPGTASFPNVAIFRAADVSRLLGRAVGEPSPYLIHRGLAGAAAATAPRSDADRAVVRVFVFREISGDTEAFPVAPTYFHSDELARLGYRAYFPRMPLYSYDPADLAFILDPASDPLAVAARLRREDAEQFYGVYLDDGRTALFLHVLGHVLGLPHPGESTLVDSGPWQGNITGGGWECLPTCDDVRISSHQCEVILSGMTGFVREPNPAAAPR